ncbi:hypothetical protein BDV96DRAFT_613707 [Lophiotrema nucula]|uniref:Uncharacterized protein n=1 Tax=Lophiotrema nucula TaxID=690887 RepID=A0A6A5Z1E5_9PLEO|nr:hypothetical protein BDV96DRAFT_613707 [Lophiotrema nucula]
MAFEWAHRLQGHHLIAQPSDLALNPPEVYFYVQDFLIISCGIFYALCYTAYITRTYRDKTLSGTILYMPTCIAYEIYYAYTCTTTTFEKLGFSVWFMMDIAFCTVAVKCAYPPHKRRITSFLLVFGTIFGLGFYHTVSLYWPDEREQLTAYWTGTILQLPISVSAPYLLLKTGSTKGHSIEIWISRYLGVWTAFSLFIWRYVNVPENWEYVASFWSMAMIVTIIVCETVYPFVYVWVHLKEKRREERNGVKVNGKKVQ